MVKQTIGNYDSLIWKLKQQKIEIKDFLMKTYGWNGATGNGTNKRYVLLAYSEAIRVINVKLKYLRTSKTLLNNKQDVVREVGHLLEEFLNTSVRYSVKITTKEDRNKIDLGRKILSKYILEANLKDKRGNAITSRHVANFLSPTGKCQNFLIVQWRKRFTISFKANKHNRASYYRFLDFVKHRQTL